MRKPDTSRKAKRDEVKDRKKREKEEKKEDLKMLKKYKLKEIQEKLEQLKNITGNASLPFQVWGHFIQTKSIVITILHFRTTISKVTLILINTIGKWARFLIKIITMSTMKIKSQNFLTTLKSMMVLQQLSWITISTISSFRFKL